MVVTMADWSGENNSWVLWLMLALVLLSALSLLIWLCWRGAGVETSSNVLSES